MKKQLILVRADLQSFQADEAARCKSVDDLTRIIREEILSKEPIGILVCDKSYIESISIVEVDVQDVIV